MLCLDVPNQKTNKIASFFITGRFVSNKKENPCVGLKPLSILPTRAETKYIESVCLVFLEDGSGGGRV